ncbi:MAG: hypothetical protein RLO12_15850, partial [Fulvivirga sp.]
MGYIFDIIFYTSFITAGVAAIYGLNLIRLKTINLLVLLVVISFLADVIQAISSFYYTQYNVDLGIRSVGSIYRILEFMILMVLFRSFNYNLIVKNLMTILAITLTLYFIKVQPDFFRIYVDSTLIRISSASLVIIFGMLFYKSIITKMNIPNIEKWPPFYFFSALFIYFSGVLIAFFLYYPMMRIDRAAGSYLWSFHTAWLIVRNILLIIGFYYTYKTKYKWES